jgi:hypothetical protein
MADFTFTIPGTGVFSGNYVPPASANGRIDNINGITSNLRIQGQGGITVTAANSTLTISAEPASTTWVQSLNSIQGPGQITGNTGITVATSGSTITIGTDNSAAQISYDLGNITVQDTTISTDQLNANLRILSNTQSLITAANVVFTEFGIGPFDNTVLRFTGTNTINLGNLSSLKITLGQPGDVLMSANNSLRWVSSINFAENAVSATTAVTANTANLANLANLATTTTSLGNITMIADTLQAPRAIRLQPSSNVQLGPLANIRLDRATEKAAIVKGATSLRQNLAVSSAAAGSVNDITRGNYLLGVATQEDTRTSEVVVQTLQPGATFTVGSEPYTTQSTSQRAAMVSEYRNSMQNLDALKTALGAHSLVLYNLVWMPVLNAGAGAFLVAFRVDDGSLQLFISPDLSTWATEYRDANFVGAGRLQGYDVSARALQDVELSPTKITGLFRHITRGRGSGRAGLPQGFIDSAACDVYWWTEQRFDQSDTRIYGWPSTSNLAAATIVDSQSRRLRDGKFNIRGARSASTARFSQYSTTLYDPFLLISRFLDDPSQYYSSPNNNYNSTTGPWELEAIDSSSNFTYSAVLARIRPLQNKFNITSRISHAMNLLRRGAVTEYDTLQHLYRRQDLWGIFTNSTGNNVDYSIISVTYNCSSTGVPLVAGTDAPSTVISSIDPGGTTATNINGRVIEFDTPASFDNSRIENMLDVPVYAIRYDHPDDNAGDRLSGGRLVLGRLRDPISGTTTTSRVSIFPFNSRLVHDVVYSVQERRWYVLAASTTRCQVYRSQNESIVSEYSTFIDQPSTANFTELSIDAGGITLLNPRGVITGAPVTVTQENNWSRNKRISVDPATRLLSAPSGTYRVVSPDLGTNTYLWQKIQ